MKKILFLTLTVCLTFCACHDTLDGVWDSMRWKADAPMTIADGVYQIPAAGTEASFTCTNYSRPWICEAFILTESGEQYIGPEYGEYLKVAGEWFQAEMNGNKLTVAFAANDTEQYRTIRLTVTAGDIFHTFDFTQYK